VDLDGIWLKRSWGGEVKNVSVLLEIGVNRLPASAEELWMQPRRTRPVGKRFCATSKAEGLKGCGFDRLGQVLGTGGDCGGVLPGSEVAAVHG
jgi:hypothetical protein